MQFQCHVNPKCIWSFASMFAFLHWTWILVALPSAVVDVHLCTLYNELMKSNFSKQITLWDKTGECNATWRGSVHSRWKMKIYVWLYRHLAWHSDNLGATQRIDRRSLFDRWIRIFNPSLRRYCELHCLENEKKFICASMQFHGCCIHAWALCIYKHFAIWHRQLFHIIRYSSLLNFSTHINSIINRII